MLPDAVLQLRFHVVPLQGVQSPLAGQIVFRSVLFGAFGAAKRWLSTNADGTTRPLTTADFYKVRSFLPWPDTSTTMTSSLSATLEHCQYLSFAPFTTAPAVLCRANAGYQMPVRTLL